MKVGSPILDIGRALAANPKPAGDTRRERLRALAKELREAKDEDATADALEALLTLKDSES